MKNRITFCIEYRNQRLRQTLRIIHNVRSLSKSVITNKHTVPINMELLNLTNQYHTDNKRNNFRKIILAIIPVLFFGVCYAQVPPESSHIQINKNLTYRQTVNPDVLDNYLYSTFYGTDKICYNLKGFDIGHSSKKITSIKVNPAGASYAVLSSNGKKSQVEIFDAYLTNKKLYEFKTDFSPTAIAYSKDSRKLFIATINNSLNIYNARSFILERTISLPFAPNIMETSSNDYYLAVSNDYSTAIIDIETGIERTSIPNSERVIHISFNDDSSMFGILSNSVINIYDTRTFAMQVAIPLVGNPSCFSFHPEGKYVSIALSDNIISFVNLTDLSDRPSITDPDGHITYVRFVKDGKKHIYLTYNSLKSIKYKQLSGFSPNFTRLLKEELLARMEDWSKIREGESIEDYKLRVNEESRIKQAKLFEQEIATRMADNMVMSSTVSLGGYNPENNMLTLNFDNLPTVYLTVPEKEVQDFMTTENLEFRDAVYGITKDDKFELIYANVYNKVTGKEYVFNNLDRQSLDFLSTESNFVPIELVQQSSMEELKLNSIKRDVVENAMKQNLISDHTNIQVNTNVVSDYDASGNRITNYKVGFNYSVEAQYSADEDFKAGKYQINQSNAAESMLKIVVQAFESDFAQYIQTGKKVLINITGSADALPIKSMIVYDGRYGDFENEPYYLDGNLSTIRITKNSNIKKNEQLAFLRAAAVKDYIQTNITSLGSMNTDYKYNIELSDKKGGEYRRISVEFTFINAF